MADGSRPTTLELDFPKIGKTLHAKLLWDMNPQLCELFVESLPFTTIYSHTTASGEGMYAPTRVVGTVPAKHMLLTEMPHGTLTLSTDNYKTLGLFYGRITEPLPGFPPVAQVVDEDLDDMRVVGREVWLSNTVSHDPIDVTVRVVDEKEQA
ncbi:MAG: hypothetical protein JST59_05455 [Actinobacteria bacterium]|nr:hypothetical protein [Actinomycetota bacterium]